MTFIDFFVRLGRIKLFWGFYNHHSKFAIAWEWSDGKRNAISFSPFFLRWYSDVRWYFKKQRQEVKMS